MTIREGQTITGENFIDVPPGSIITSSGYTAIVLNHGYAVRRDGGYSSLYPMFNLAGWSVSKIGDWPVLRETPTQFLQRAWTVCLGAARDNSVRTEPVTEALLRVGATSASPLGVGMWFHMGDRDTGDRLRRKRGVVYGYGDPNHWDGYAEVDIDRERATLGGAGMTSRVVRVLAMEDPDTDQYLVTPTEVDVAEVARLRGRMWTIGLRAKEQERWCPQYEAAMGVIGISALSAQTDETGVRITAPEASRVDSLGRARIGNGEEEARAYPAGAIFQYPSTDDLTYTDGAHWNWQRRVEDGRWNTCHYLGPNPGQYGGHRTVLYDGVGAMRIPLHRNLMRWLPVGTRVTGGGSMYYYKVVASSDTNPLALTWANGPEEGACVRDDGFFGTGRDTTDAWWIDQLPETHDGQSPSV